MQFHYTPQQMAGSVKYGHKCRIGNWNEDTALEDESVKNFLNARETSTLTVSRLQVSLASRLVGGVQAHALRTRGHTARPLRRHPQPVVL